MKKIIVIFMFLGFLSVSACSNTFEGLGKDIQDLGKSIEKSTKD
ncbi:MAG: entericidin A/B family lipoprotein [Gammaproteobacteria bacterium]|nr:entericidin A/B family lipoprotein [Gammaproteobacteria bacterium]